MLSHDNKDPNTSDLTIEDNTHISNLCKTILPTYTHTITHHNITTKPIICYSLYNDGTGTFYLDPVVEAICAFFKFHICQNFIFQSHSASRNNRFTPANKIVKIKINANGNTTTIDPENILQTLSLPILVIISPLTYTLKTFISSLLGPILENNPIHISCEVLLKKPITKAQLLKTLQANEPSTKAVTSFYHILKMYEEQLITNITDPVGNLSLNIFHIYTHHQTLTPQTTLGIIRSFSSQSADTSQTTQKRHFLKAISELCLFSNTTGVEIYKLNTKILQQLPNFTEQAFQLKSFYNIQKHTTNYKLLCNDLTDISTCNQLYNYIYLIIILHTTDNIQLSLKLSLKEEFKNNSYVPAYSYDINIDSNIKEIMLNIYFENNKSSKFKKFLAQNISQPNNITQDILQKYNISIQAYATNISQETTLPCNIVLPKILTTSATTTETHKTKTDIKTSATTEKCRTDSSSSETEFSKKSVDHSTINIKSLPTIQQSKTGDSQKRTSHIVRQKSKPPIICLVVVAIALITIYYILSEKFLTDIPDISKINIVVIAGIFSLTLICMFGIILYNYIDEIYPPTNIENTISPVLGSPSLSIN
ncbi:hypothetical protein EDL79_00540 [Ehrlichia ruminantium]|uniref:Uncharacterized protein n=1 Tax=Ehrlichia ruminantium TaxID=779 RepID=A0AAE6Q8K1_EHRRU|nr:hypothetical protein [Ehrlichia ruminantium]QGR02186.1 hypothetical protein EDL81_00540 [Ehrlichia ruminantium]QGR03107.1 hypothetical protein EDL80_00540 [Ehrlichia ruminantium]QGR04032.1 hypothetical protein EDL79_00540 [Ehrlichia ruminantium]